MSAWDLVKGLKSLATAIPTTERMTILVNRNVKMSPGKMAAQVAHAALTAHGIRHGAIVVLTASPSAIERDCDVQIRDAGLTEVEPGTLTCGVRATRDEAEA